MFGEIAVVVGILSTLYVVATMIMVLIIFTNINYLNNVKTLNKNKSEYDNLYQYTKSIESELRKHVKDKHEIGNRLIGLKVLVKDDRKEEAIEFMDNMIPYSNKIEDCSNINFEKITDTMVKTLLINKVSVAISRGVTIKSDIRCDLNNLNITLTDLNDIISILMDNATEAAIQSEEKSITMLISNDENNNVCIIVFNSKDKKRQHIEELYTVGSSTKGNGRGHGLLILADIEERNESVIIETTESADIFVQEIYIGKLEKAVN